MTKSFTSESNISINAPREVVWEALTNPEQVKQWFFGTELTTTWQLGDPIVFRGEWQGSTYEDKGTIVAIKQGEMFEYTHFSSRTGLPDVPENYEQVAFYLSNDAPDSTTVTVKESNLKTKEHRETSLKLWPMILGNLKNLVEQQG